MGASVCPMVMVRHGVVPGNVMPGAAAAITIVLSGLWIGHGVACLWVVVAQPAAAIAAVDAGFGDQHPVVGFVLSGFLRVAVAGHMLVEEAGEGIAHTELRLGGHRCVGGILLFIGRLCAFPSRHGRDLRTEKCRRAIGKAEACSLAADDGALRIVVFLPGNGVAQCDVVVVDDEGDDKTLSLGIGESHISGVCLEVDMRAFCAGHVVVLLLRVVAAVGERHAVGEVAKVSDEAKPGRTQHFLAVESDGISRFAVSVGKPYDELSVWRSDGLVLGCRRQSHGEGHSEKSCSKDCFFVCHVWVF